MGKNIIFYTLFIILLPLVFAYNYGEGNYSDSFYGTGYYVAPENNIINETSEENLATIYSSYSSKTYFSDSKISTEGNNFNLRYSDKIKFIVNFTNHTLIMQNFNSTSAKVVINSDPINALLQKGILYEFDLNNDSANDVKIKYSGTNKTQAMIFIQEMVYSSDSKENIVEDFLPIENNKFNWKIFWIIFVLIIISILFFIWKKFGKSIREYLWIKKIKRSHRQEKDGFY
jgi:ATP-dependent Zn protease